MHIINEILLMAKLCLAGYCVYYVNVNLCLQVSVFSLTSSAAEQLFLLIGYWFDFTFHCKCKDNLLLFSPLFVSPFNIFD